jgi:hypothetical protein
MTIASEIQRIEGNISAAYSAADAKGATIPATENSDNLATCIASIPSGGGGSGKYQLLERVKDDSNNEIGTVSGFFTDANDVEYAVVCLDTQYRSNNKEWCTDSNTVTNMPLYSSSLSEFWYDNAKETATTNTQLIIDYCTAGGYTSGVCDFCRTQSFTIDGTTYYGQVPNMRELFDIWVNRVEINTKDTTTSSSRYTNFDNARNLWSSTQYSNTDGWMLQNSGKCDSNAKTSRYIVVPVLELPNN